MIPVILVGLAYWAGATAGLTNLDQARQGLTDLRQRTGAFRMTVEWQGSGSSGQRPAPPKTSSGIFDRDRYRITTVRDGIPGKTGYEAARQSEFCYDGRRAIAYYVYPDSPAEFYIESEPDAIPTAPFNFVLTPFVEILSRPGVTELEPQEIFGAMCVGFESPVPGEFRPAGLRGIQRVWLDPSHGWFPRRIETLDYSVDDPAKVVNIWTEDVVRLDVNAKGVPFAAEITGSCRVGDYVGTPSTSVCTRYDTGVEVADDMFTMAPSPGVAVLDFISGYAYTAGEEAEGVGSLIDAAESEKGPSPGKEDEHRSLTEKRPPQSEDVAIPGRLAHVAVTATLVAVAFGGLAMAMRRGRRSR